jgi:SPOR domain
MIEMKKLTFLIGSLIIGFTGLAQVNADTLKNGVVVMKDARINTLLKKQADINKKVIESKKPTKGFRIQVLNTTDRNQALSAKSKLLSLYPEHKVYLMYQAPYFKIRFGNFADRNDANNLKKELSRMFPAGVFIIPSEIEIKQEKEREKDDQK